MNFAIHIKHWFSPWFAASETLYINIRKTYPHYMSYTGDRILHRMTLPRGEYESGWEKRGDMMNIYITNRIEGIPWIWKNIGNTDHLNGTANDIPIRIYIYGSYGGRTNYIIEQNTRCYRTDRIGFRYGVTKIGWQPFRPLPHGWQWSEAARINR